MPTTAAPHEIYFPDDGAPLSIEALLGLQATSIHEAMDTLKTTLESELSGEDTDWANLPLVTGLTALTSTPQYCRKNGFVYLRGTVSGDIASAKICATLPPGFRPAAYARYGTPTSDSASPMRRLNITAAGNIELNQSGSGNITWQALDGIAPFFAAK